ncbi:MAG TPA: ADOP family duplicated permease [Terracidiphilus sp.]|jgi:predicted permease
MWIDRQDLLYSIRSARRPPLMTFVAIAALTLGIGLNAGVFTLLNTMFLDSPVQKEPASFVELYPKYEGWFTGAAQFSAFTTEDYEALRSQSHALSEMAAWQQSSAVLENQSRRIDRLLVTCNYFHVFGVDRPVLGRFFSPAECKPGTAVRVAVLSEPYWKTQFGSNPHIVGKVIHLNGVPVEVVGVFPSEAVNVLANGIYLPYTLQPVLDRSNNLYASPDSPWLSVAGRLSPGYSKADVQAEAETILRRQDLAYLHRKVTPFNRRTSVVVTNGSFIATPSIHDLAVTLMALILGPLSLVLLLACSNVTMLFLSRAIVRRGEIAVRLALGVSRARLARMLLLESVLTAGIAGALSVVLAYRVPQMLLNVMDPEESGFLPIMHPDWHVFAYLGALVVIAAISSSLAPMHASWKLDLLAALKGREGAATSRSRTTAGLIIAQIAMSFVLLAAAVLFARIPSKVTGMDPGFETRHTLVVPLNIDTSAQNRTTALNFHQALESRLLALPSVQSVAYETLQPFRQTPPAEILMPGQLKGQGKPSSIDVVSKDFFSTFGIRSISGRFFASQDGARGGATSVAVVSQAFARKFWPDGNPLGKVVVTPDGRHLTVIGVVADIRSEHFGVLDGPRLYALRDNGSLDGTLYVRFTGDAKTAANAVNDAMRALDPSQTETPQTIWDSLEENAEALRTLARIILAMALIAVLLAITGVYGVLSFAVNQRTREFGIRMVLGANRASIFRSIMLRGVRQIGIGLLCGFALAEPAAFLFTRLLKRSPLPVQSFDLSLYVITAILLVAVSLAAMYLPAIRATRVDPMKALRTE